MPPVDGGGGYPAVRWPTSSAHTAHEGHEYQQQRQATFQALRPVTTQLLQLRDQPEQLQPQLVVLQQLLQELPPEGVEGCWDYVAFPLMVLLDAIVPSRQKRLVERSSTGGGTSGDGASDSACGERAELLAAACRSDRVVEALLGALLVLLVRSTAPENRRDDGVSGKRDGGVAHVRSPIDERSVAALQHLAPLLQLGREEASEEILIALQRCVSAALTLLAAKPEVTVVKLSGGATTTPASTSSLNASVMKHAVLCNEDLAPLVGYLLHCCLEVSEREVLAGRTGSKALCAAAMSTLGSLLAALPDADIMGFFLPGIVSALSKHLYAAGSAATLSGPSAPPGATAIVQALKCLRIAITTVLSDESVSAIQGSNAAAADSAVTPAGGASLEQMLSLSEIRSADVALSALKQLRLSASTDTADQASSTSTTAELTVGMTSCTSSASSAPIPAQQQQQQQQPRRLRVDRTLGWLHDTSARVNSLLGRTLPPLCSHPRPAVRAELTATVATLIDCCSRALSPSQPVLLRLLFTLAQDEWALVALPCREWVARHAPSIVASVGVTLPTAAVQSQSASQVVPVPQADVSAGPSNVSGGGLGGNATCAGGEISVSSDANTRQPADLKALEDEFERFMQGLMSDSVLLENPALDLGESELYGGSDEGVGERDQGFMALQPAQSDGDSTPAEVAPPTVWSTLSSSVSPPPPLPALPGLQRLIAESATSTYLLRAVRAGEAQAVVQARCLTTALLVAGPSRVAEWVLLRPTALADLLAGLIQCFAVDRNAATLVLHLRGEAGSYAPAVVAAKPNSLHAPGAKFSEGTAAAVAAAGARDAAMIALAGSASTVAELPRMPLCLLHLSSQKSYLALATVARSLGRLARAVDSSAAPFSTAAVPHYQGAAGSVLRRLIDKLTTDLRCAVARGGTTAAEASGVPGSAPFVASGSAAGFAGRDSWQCEAAAVAAVAAEAVIGASNAWVPPLGAASEPESGRGAEPPSLPFPLTDPAFESILLGLLQELMRPDIIKLPTHNSGGGTSGREAAARAVVRPPMSYDDVVRPDLAAPRQQLTAQALGENVMLLRAVLEVVGTAARALGHRFVSQGRLLRTVLVPLLELLGDPSPPVAAAADTALQSICVHCGYGGSLTSLLGGNADYVVDSLCARLRDLQRHPRAPHLLAALLRRAGVAPQLLPLMAEPLQRALQGLSPLARHWAPHYAHSYLAVLRELAAGAAAEAAAAGDASRREVAELNRLAAKARDEELVAEAAAEAARSEGFAASEGFAEPSETPRCHEDVERFFMEHNSAARKGAGAGSAAAEGKEQPRRRQLTLTAEQLEDSELRFRRLHAAAVVAGAAADAATPLVMSSDLSVAITALEVLRSALAALAAATPMVEAEAAVVEEYGGAEARMRPVRPETPKVLPAVAGAWSPLMAALRDARTPVVERGIAAVAEVVAAAGGAFLARRFQQEAWPVLQRLLTHGSAHTPGLLSLGTEAARSAAAPRRRLEIGVSGSCSGERGITVSGGEDATGALAPAAVTRVQVAVLRCLEAVCRCPDAGVAVRTLTWAIAQVVLPFLGASHVRPLHEAAEATLMAVAALDPDGVWLLLYDTSCNKPTSLTAASRGWLESAESRPSGLPLNNAGAHGHQTQKAIGLAPMKAPGSAFPQLGSLLPSLQGAKGVRLHPGAPSAQWPVTAAVAADCGPRAQSLLAAVAALEAPWHGTKIPAVDIVVE